MIVTSTLTRGADALTSPENTPMNLRTFSGATALLLGALLPAVTTSSVIAQDLQQRIANQRRSVIVDAVQRVAPSVASVVVSGIQRVPIFDDPMYREFFGFGPSENRRVRVQSGSAVMISENGEFVTNFHGVEGADRIALLLPNGETRPAELVGSSAKLDIALLRTDPTGLQPAPLGRAKDLLVGEWLVAVGYPVGSRGVSDDSRFQPTVTVGVVSALERSFKPSIQRSARLYYPDMIQTDAAINPGNSGGPLANAAGEIVGINTFILSDSGGSQGLGFAIPIERALRAATELRTYGKVRDADFAGLEIAAVTARIALDIGMEEARGLLVVAPGALGEAGLRQHDVILAVGSDRVDEVEDARGALLPRFVGDEVILAVWRDGRPLSLPLTLTEARH
jgi:serine protease Do